MVKCICRNSKLGPKYFAVFHHCTGSQHSRSLYVCNVATEAVSERLFVVLDQPHDWGLHLQYIRNYRGSIFKLTLQTVWIVGSPFEVRHLYACWVLVWEQLTVMSKNASWKSITMISHFWPYCTLVEGNANLRQSWAMTVCSRLHTCLIPSCLVNLLQD